ncbi:MAG: glycosyltransferase [Candidatus Omnitrophica bacterium]|nr:glycosyltransferase [Candidatus Omnitrophota bacterium]MBD3269062.1 glycosyltransferase [Candidatus Omnitrophota bacterium]
MQEEKELKISVVMPVFNEADTIGEVVERIRRIPYQKEIIIVDDGSTDSSCEIIKKLSAPFIKKIFHKKNRGKGASIKSALPVMNHDILIIQDADLEYYPEEYPKLIEPIIKGEADVVFGSRFIENGRYSSLIHFVGNKIINLTAAFLYGKKLSDLLSCYKVFKREIIKSIDLQAEGFGFEAEITGEVLRRKCRLKEVPISYVSRSYSEGKKIKRRDFFTILWWLFRTKLKKRKFNKKATHE